MTTTPPPEDTTEPRKGWWPTEHPRHTVPRYGMLDVWMALGLDPAEFDAWADRLDYADAWAHICAAVRATDRPAAPAPATVVPDSTDPHTFEHTPEAAAFGAAIEQATIDSGVGWDEVHPIELACRLMAAGYVLAVVRPDGVSAEQAWDEGYTAGVRDAPRGEPGATANPYRTGSPAGGAS